MPPAAADSPRDEGRQGSTPSSLGFRMPAEWEPHECCIIGWPTEIRTEVWGEQYLLAKASYAAVAHAIPICPCLLDDFGHFSKDGDRRFGQQLGKRLRARASLCVAERLIKRDGDKFNHLNLSIGRLRRQIDFKDAFQL